MIAQLQSQKFVILNKKIVFCGLKTKFEEVYLP